MSASVELWHDHDPVSAQNPLPVSAAGAAVAADGTPLPLASLAQSLSYNPDGTLAHVQVTYQGVAYRQSMTWTNGSLTAVSAWEVQP